MAKSKRTDMSQVFELANFYLRTARYESAEGLLRTALAEHGDQANILHQLGLMLHYQSKFQEAIEAFHKALYVNPSHTEAALNLIITYCDLGMYEQAEDLAVQYMERGDLAARESSVFVLGKLANQHVDLARKYEVLEKYADAIQEYKRALQLYRDMPDVRMSLATLYSRMGQIDKAILELEECQNQGCRIPDVYCMLGSLNQKLGRMQLARENIRYALDMDPSNRHIRAYLRSLDADKSP